MGKRSERLFIFISLFILSLLLASFRWPLKDGRITSTFGESRGDHFHDGVDMTSLDKKVHPVQKGSLVFFWDKSLFPIENYPGPGNFKVLSHGNNIYSLYMHLEDGGSYKQNYSGEDTVGNYGSTGHSYGSHIHFTIFDPIKRLSFNPLMLIAGIEDIKPPEIAGIHIKIGDKYVQIRDKSNIRLTKHYPILLDVYDTMGGSEKLGVYKLTVLLNNKKVFDSIFQKLNFSQAGLSILHKTFLEVYDVKGYYRIGGLKYQNGDNILRIIANDYSGNISEKEYSFNVILDMPSDAQ